MGGCETVVAVEIDHGCGSQITFSDNRFWAAPACCGNKTWNQCGMCIPVVAGVSEASFNIVLAEGDPGRAFLSSQP